MVCNTAARNARYRASGVSAVLPYQGDFHHGGCAEPGMTQGPLSAADIRRLFEELASELDVAGHRAEIFLVGGAAIALCFDARRATRDLDAVFAPTDSVRRADAKVADREGLDPDWLNDAVKGFLPGPDEDSRPVPNIRGLEVTTASPRYLLALKLMAMRFGEDDQDIEILLRECGLRTAREALDLLQHLYPYHEPPVKTRLFLEELLGPAAD